MAYNKLTYWCGKLKLEILFHISVDFYFYIIHIPVNLLILFITCGKLI